MGRNNCATTREAATEIVALHLFGIADREGLPVTRRLCESRLGELASHPVDCRCAAPCGLAPLVSVSKVYWVASRWQLSIARTRLLAQR